MLDNSPSRTPRTATGTTWRFLALLLVLLLQGLPPVASAQVCEDSVCNFIPGPTNLSRNCPAPGGPCNPAVAACSCQDIIGCAAWDPKTQQWRGSFHDCWCVTNGVLSGPKKCGGRLQYRVYKRAQGGKGDRTIAFDVYTDDSADAFVHMFDETLISPTGMIDHGMVLFEHQGITGSMEFLPLDDDQADRSARYPVQLTSLQGTLGSFPFAGLLCGPTTVELVGSTTAMYDSSSEELWMDDFAQVLVRNNLYPAGLPASLRVDVVEHRGTRYAIGQIRGEREVGATAEYDARDAAVTFRITQGEPNTTHYLGVELACLGDVDGDRDVDMDDHAVVLASLGACEPGVPCPADIDLNGYVEDADAALVMANLGCSDAGWSSLGFCGSMNVAMGAPLWLSLTTDSDGLAELALPVGGLGLSAWRWQFIDSSNCIRSLMGRITIP